MIVCYRGLHFFFFGFVFLSPYFERVFYYKNLDIILNNTMHLGGIFCVSNTHEAHTHSSGSMTLPHVCQESRLLERVLTILLEASVWRFMNLQTMYNEKKYPSI